MKTGLPGLKVTSTPTNPKLDALQSYQMLMQVKWIFQGRLQMLTPDDPQH